MPMYGELKKKEAGEGFPSSFWNHNVKKGGLSQVCLDYPFLSHHDFWMKRDPPPLYEMGRGGPSLFWNHSEKTFVGSNYIWSNLIFFFSVCQRDSLLIFTCSLWRDHAAGHWTKFVLVPKYNWSHNNLWDTMSILFLSGFRTLCCIKVPCRSFRVRTPPPSLVK